MTVHKVVMSKEIERTSENSGATHSDGKSDQLEVKGNFNVKCKVGDNNNCTPKKYYRVAGFVAFNADYQGPKHHSPTHN